MQTFRNPYPDDESNDDELNDDESNDDELNDDELTDDELTKDELTDDELNDDELTKDELTDNKSSYLPIPPDPSIIMESLRDIGYTLEMAISDIIDNSISAAADNIHINFDFNEKKNDFFLEIIDDGFGMNREQLEIAMKIGSKNPNQVRPKSDMGRFGLGLKTASFSQCRRLTVESFSKENKDKNSFTWDLDKIVEEKDWICIDNKKPLINVGTKIIWEKLDRLEIDLKKFKDPQKIIQIKIGEIVAKIEKHISLIFHRFIDDKNLEKNIRKISIFLNNTKIKPFNPFNELNNATFISPVTQLGDMKIRYYILPHKDKCEGKEYEDYAGEEGYMANQGFYVYRNFRLIIWGTWFGIIDKLNAYKLCRVKIDIGNEMDSNWRIDVKKSNAKPPKKIRDFLEEYLPKVEIKGKRVFEHKAKKYSTEDNYQIWIQNQIKRTKSTTFKLNRKNSLIRKILNIEHGEEILKEIEESVPYELINFHINDTKHKFQAIWDPKKQVFMDGEKKKVQIFREDKIDDNAIKQMIMERAERKAIELTTADIDWIME